MNQTEILQKFSSEELEKLLETKKKIEQEINLEHLLEKLTYNENELKSVKKRYKFEIKKLKEEIKTIKKMLSKYETPIKDSHRRKNLISQIIIDFIQTHQICSIKSLQVMLTKKGLNTQNIHQTIAYLVRKNRLVHAPQRGHYQLAHS